MFVELKLICKYGCWKTEAVFEWETFWHFLLQNSTIVDPQITALLLIRCQKYESKTLDFALNVSSYMRPKQLRLQNEGFMSNLT